MVPGNKTSTKGCLAPFCFFCFFLLFICSPLTHAEESSYHRAIAAYQQRHFDEALPLAQKAVREEPENVEAYVLLGQLYYFRQELEKARDSWERAFKLSPSREDLQQVLTKLKSEEPIENVLSRSDTYPFVIRYAEGEIPVHLGELRKILRDVYRLSGQQFNRFPRYAIPVILYKESDFDRVRGITHKAAGLYDGKIRLPLKKDLPGEGISASEDLTRVLWHEYAHLLVHELAEGRCPLWLNEGLAVFQESRIFSPSLRELKIAFDAQKIPSWQELWAEKVYPTDSLEIRYEEGYLIVRYLIHRWGWPKMRRLLHRLAQGALIGDALKAEYRLLPATIEKQWRDWVYNLL